MVKGKAAGTPTPRKQAPKHTPPKDTPEAGHNNGPRDLTEEERDVLCQHHVGTILRWKNKLKTLVAEGANHYKVAKVDGFIKKEIDKQIALDSDGGEEKLGAELQMLRNISRRLGYGSQLDMFDQPDRTPVEDKAYADGRRAGARGEDPKPPPNYTGTLMQKWMQGHSDAQAVLREALGNLKTPIEKAAKHKPAIDDSEFERTAPAGNA